jgi:hypothetical protein
MLALTKHWQRQNIGAYRNVCVDKNVGVDKILALTKYWRRRSSISLLFGSEESTAADFSQT